MVNDYVRLRRLFAAQLRELARIEAEGDYETLHDLIGQHARRLETGVQRELQRRHKRLGIQPFRGFLQPRLAPVMEGEAVIDAKLVEPASFADEQLYLSEHHSFLPTYN